MPPDTQTDHRWDAVWVWSEDDVVHMVEQAGFTAVTIRYASLWGNDPVSKTLITIGDRFGIDMRDLRLVTAIKQQPNRALTAAREPSEALGEAPFHGAPAAGPTGACGRTHVMGAARSVRT